MIILTTIILTSLGIAVWYVADFIIGALKDLKDINPEDEAVK